MILVYSSPNRIRATVWLYWTKLTILKKKKKNESVLNDKSKFQVIKGDWLKHIIALEDKLNRNLRKIKK